MRELRIARWSRRFCEADVFAEKMSKVSFGQLCFRWVGLLGYFSCGVTSVEKTSGVCYHVDARPILRFATFRSCQVTIKKGVSLW